MTTALRAPALALLVATRAMAQDAPAHTPAKPPPFDPRRYTENYSYVLDPAQRTGAWWEPLKAVPLGDDVDLELGGEIRLRTESYAGNLFSRAPVAHQTYVWDRALPYASLHVGGHVRAFVQFEAAYAQGERPSPTPIDETGIDLLQGFVEADVPVGDAHLTARVGRQVLTYGDGALIDSRFGPNVLQSFDGAFVDLRTAHRRFDLFWARPVVNGLRDFDDRTSGGQQIWGAIASRDIAGLKGGVLDVYYFGFETARRRSTASRAVNCATRSGCGTRGAPARSTGSSMPSASSAPSAMVVSAPTRSAANSAIRSRTRRSRASARQQRRGERR